MTPSIMEKDKKQQSTEKMNDTEQNNSSSSQQGSREVFRVGVKPPTFCKEQPDIYFIQMESQFAVAGITRDDTMYHHVISSLEPHFLLQVADIIRNPPTDNKYIAVKTALIAEYTDSDHRKLKKLIKEIELGDLKPSQLLKRMKDLAGNKISDDALKSLWMERLPETVRSVITIVDGNSTQMALQADKIMEVQNYPTIASVQQDSTLRAEIDELRSQLQQMRSSNHYERGRSNDHNQQQRNRSKSKSKVRFPFCKFHYRFGDKARKCVEPCQYKNLKPEN